MVMLICSERDALDFLLKCWRDPDFGKDGLVFESCALNIRLDPGDGKANWKTVRATRLLQRHIELTYLLAKRGDPSGRLSDFERDLLSVVVTTTGGSTNHSFDITKSLTAIDQVLPAHWSPRTRSIVAAGVLIAIIGFPYASQFAAYRAEIDKAQILAATQLQVADKTNQTNLEIAQINANAQTSVAEIQARGSAGAAAAKVHSAHDAPAAAAPVILANLVQADTSRIVAFAVSDYVPWRPALLELAPYAGTFTWNDNPPISQRQAKAIAKSLKAEVRTQRRIAKENGNPALFETPWVTEILRTHSAPGAMRLGLTEA